MEMQPTAERRSLAELPFVVSTGTGKEDAAIRKLIRSHVMLGKNKGKPRPTKCKKVLPWEAVLVPIPAEDTSALQESVSVVPKRVGSDWSFIQLADEIEPIALAEILECEFINRKRDEASFILAVLTSSVNSLRCQERCHSPFASVRGLPHELCWTA